jgi:hypothetical protein
MTPVGERCWTATPTVSACLRTSAPASSSTSTNPGSGARSAQWTAAGLQSRQTGQRSSVTEDTSALLRLFIPDGPIPEGLEERVTEAGRHEAVLLVPSMAFAGATQVLLKKERAGFLTTGEADL